MSKFSDIGKSTNDLLNKDFPIHVIKIEAKGVEKTGQNFLSKFNLTGTRDSTTGAVNGEVKNTLTALASRPFAFTQDLKHAPLVVEATGTISSHGAVTEKIEFKDSLVKGLNTSVTGVLSNNNPIGVKFETDFARALASNLIVSHNATMDLSKGPKVLSDSVMRYCGFVLGAQAELHRNFSMENVSAAVGYEVSHYKATMHAMNKGNLIAASFYQKFTSGVETGFKATWNRKTANQYGIDLVAKFPLDALSWLKLKCDNNGKLGVAYCTALNAKVSMTLAAAFDTMKMDATNHRLGLGLVVDL